jgi:hypothetical protein
MEPNKTAIERAFELARSGGCADISHIRARLVAEGYSANQISGPRLIRQIRDLCEGARQEQTQES